MTWTSDNTLFLDMDGVLADFDFSAEKLCGMAPRLFEEKYGSEKFWATINSDPNFFLNLRPMPDAMELYNAVKKHEPIILTGIPQGMDPDVNQKRDWGRMMFGHHQRVICCQSSKKSLYIKALGDILVDDRQRYMRKWLARGGYFIIHKNAADSIMKLKNLGVPI
jgi:5'(3')-deoxyribonucleotidase